MIKSVKVYKKPDKSDAFTMVLTDPTNVSNSSGFAIDSIDGLGPVEAEINTTELVTDCDMYNSARIGKRNIVMDLLFYSEGGGSEIESVRQTSYRLFPTKKEVYIEIETDNRTLYTKGYVEHNEPDIFREDSGCQISIICPDPKLYDADGTQTTTLTPNDEETLEYEGEVEVGGYLVLTIADTIVRPVADGDPAFTVSCTKEDGTSQSIDIYTPPLGFEAGDVITISSITGDKYAIYTDHETEVDSNMLHLISQNPDWITVANGDNNIRVTDANNALASVTFENYVCFEGV